MKISNNFLDSRYSGLVCFTFILITFLHIAIHAPREIGVAHTPYVQQLAALGGRPRSQHAGGRGCGGQRLHKLGGPIVADEAALPMRAAGVDDDGVGLHRRSERRVARGGR